MATFVVRGQDKEGRGVLLFSRALEDVIPAEQRGEQIPQRRGEKAVAGDLQPEALDKLLHDLEPGAESEPLTESKRSRTGGDSSSRNIDMVLDIQLVATARLGKVEMPIGEILSLGPGSIIEVGHLVDEPVELLVNNKLIARGDVVVVDEKFGLRITEIVSPKERIESLR
jgi:flagellar motor switch protein FliN/FliY